MNKRIKELAEQAGFMEAWFSESGDDCEREIKKFAELTVKECIQLANDEASRFYNMDEDVLGSIMENFREKLKKHFKVLENTKND